MKSGNPSRLERDCAAIVELHKQRAMLIDKCWRKLARVAVFDRVRSSAALERTMSFLGNIPSQDDTKALPLAAFLDGRQVTSGELISAALAAGLVTLAEVKKISRNSESITKLAAAGGYL